MARTGRALWAALLVACGVASLGGTATAQELSQGQRLVLSEWRLTELDGRPVPRDAGMELVFWPSGRASGWGGCNVFESTWSWVPPDGVYLGPIATSRRTCRRAAGRREARYIEQLRAVERFEPTAERLTLTTTEGDGLVFRRGDQGPGVLVGPWRLVEVDGTAAPEDLEATATIGETGTIAGNTGCNEYSSPFEVDGATIRAGPVTAQLVTCDEDVMRMEAAFIRALEAATSWSVHDQTLTLRGRGGEPELEFAAIVPLVFDDLTDAGWRLARNGETDVSPTAGITAIFEDDGTLTGSGGCNRFTGSYLLEAEALSLSIDDVSVDTDRTCAAEVMSIEAAYLDALRAVSSYKIPANRLRLVSPSGDVLWFDGSASGEDGPSEAQVLADAIVGAVWRLVDALGADVREWAPVTLVLLDDGTVSGVSGCDFYDATWSVEEDVLRFRDAQGSPRVCPEDVMALQQSYLGFLPFVDGARLEGGFLVLTVPGLDDALRFELRSPAP
jgi:heat shock protein HslJ